MTHSLHRQGTYEDLCDDFVVLTFPGREFEDLPARVSKFREIGFRHQPINVPGVESLISARHLVYDSKEKFCAALKDLVAADLELSVVVSGLYNQVKECCRDIGVTPHTVNQSLGFWGRTELLPPFSILEITTMCGHGRISPNLVWDLTRQMRRNSLDAKTAARKMGKLCRCNIFNEVRAAKLIEKLVADLAAGIIAEQFPEKRDITAKKLFGITIDEKLCIRCLKCIPYCPVAAIAESPNKGEVNIDAKWCTECGMCRQAEICPVDAIVPKDLTWPRSLRGKFQCLYAPYRSAPTLAPTREPLSYNEEIFAYTRHELPTEHTNDVEGLLRHGEAEVVVELGRPHLGTTFIDVQRVSQTLIPFGMRLALQYPVVDERSPLTELITDAAKGIFRPEILGERTGWVLLKLVVLEKRVPEVVRNLQQVAKEIDTVFALDIVSRVAQDGPTVPERLAAEMGVTPAGNCKTNLGLGRPLAGDQIND